MFIDVTDESRNEKNSLAKLIILQAILLEMYDLWFDHKEKKAGSFKDN
jgi:hypothetical protein